MHEWNLEFGRARLRGLGRKFVLKNMPEEN
jgi:hypothetical protein